MIGSQSPLTDLLLGWQTHSTQLSTGWPCSYLTEPTGSQLGPWYDQLALWFRHLWYMVFYSVDPRTILWVAWYLLQHTVWQAFQWQLCNSQLYGCYLMEQQLIHNDGTIDSDTFDWCTYYTYWHQHQHQVRISFNATYHLEAEACHAVALVKQMHHGPPPSPGGPPLSLQHLWLMLLALLILLLHLLLTHTTSILLSLCHLMMLMMTPCQMPPMFCLPQPPTPTIHPGGPSLSLLFLLCWHLPCWGGICLLCWQHCISSQIPTQHFPTNCYARSPQVLPIYRILTHSILTQIHFHSLLWMVALPQILAMTTDCQTLMHMEQLQRPNRSPWSTKVKWNSHHETFDELKAIVEGHFDGYGATHLVHLEFIATYLQHGYKTLLLYPDLKLMPVNLEKQNCTLCSSLKQICQSKVAKAIIKWYQLQQDGMKTWNDFFKCYDNIGSADVKTLYYEAMLN